MKNTGPHRYHLVSFKLVVLKCSGGEFIGTTLSGLRNNALEIVQVYTKLKIYSLIKLCSVTYLYSAMSNLLRMAITLCSMTQSVDHFLK